MRGEGTVQDRDDAGAARATDRTSPRSDGVEDDLVTLTEARCGRWLGDRWLLARVLGVGGTSAVYEATHRNGRRAALKVLHPQWAVMPTARRRFLREGYISNRVEHPSVAAVLDDGETADGEAYLVIELLDGESLAATLGREGKLSVERAVLVATHVLSVLEAAHDKGIVHRDIKPDNVMLLRDGAIKVLDFGIASVRAPDVSATLATQPGGARGTPQYMAPEQARGLTVDARTDLWAVGALLFRMLSGLPVRRGPSVESLLVLAATEPAAPLQHVLPGAPPALAALVDRALTFEASGRFPTARAMLDALHAAPLHTRPPPESATLPEGAAASTEPAHVSSPEPTVPEIEAPHSPSLSVVETDAPQPDPALLSPRAPPRPRWPLALVAALLTTGVLVAMRTPAPASPAPTSATPSSPSTPAPPETATTPPVALPSATASAPAIATTSAPALRPVIARVVAPQVTSPAPPVSSPPAVASAAPAMSALDPFRKRH